MAVAERVEISTEGAKEPKQLNIVASPDRTSPVLTIPGSNGHERIVKLAKPEMERIGEIGRVPVFVDRFAADATRFTPEQYDLYQEQYDYVMSRPTKQMRREAWTGLSPALLGFYKNATRWPDMRFVYSFGEEGFGSGYEDNGNGKLWALCYPQARQLRSRGTMVTWHATDSMRTQLEALDPGLPLVYTSFACGSGDSTRQALRQIHNEKPDANILGVFLDISNSALKYSMLKAQEDGIGHLVRTQQVDLRDIARIQTAVGLQRHIDERVGYHDYTDDEQTTEYHREAYQNMAEGAEMFTSCAHENSERSTLRDVIGWCELNTGGMPDMYYKDPEQLLKTVLQAGFRPEDCEVHLTPPSYDVSDATYTMIRAKKRTGKRYF